MNSSVEKLDFLYKTFNVIDERDEAEELINKLKDEIISERATFFPKIELKEPNFEIKKHNIETSIEKNEQEIDKKETLLPNLSGSVEFNPNYIMSARFKKIKLV